MSADMPLAGNVVDEKVLAERRERFPLGAALTWDDLLDPSHMDTIHALRESEPLTWSDLVGGWFASSHEIGTTVYRDSERFTVYAEPNLVRRVLGEMMLGFDGEAHDRNRSPFAAPFKLGAVKERFAVHAQETADQLLDRLEPQGKGDLSQALASEFAIAMAASVLGLDFSNSEPIRRIYQHFGAAMAAYDDPAAIDRALAARDELNAILRGNFAAIKAGAEPGVLGEILLAPEQPLSEEELLENARVILFGAVETVEGMISSTVWALLSNPDQLAEVKADPGLLNGAIDESLRWMPPVGIGDRWTTRPLELGGVELEQGEFLIPWVVAINRDPQVFEDPDRFDIHRANARQAASFGKGIHHCLGVNLARLEGRIVLEALFERFADLRLDPDRQAKAWGFDLRRVVELPCCWD